MHIFRSEIYVNMYKQKAYFVTGLFLVPVFLQRGERVCLINIELVGLGVVSASRDLVEAETLLGLYRIEM